MPASRAVDLSSLLAILHKWGIHTLGQLAALSPDDLSARLGPEAVRLWERASGKATRLLKLMPTSESFAELFEFENEIETHEPLLFMLRRFLEQLSLRLGHRHFVAQELTLHLTFSDKQSYTHLFKIPEPTRNVETLFRMLHTHLENFTAAFPIVAVALEAQPSQSSQQQFRLFETALRDPTRLSETLARLTGLLGPDRVGTPVLENTHRSDAFHLEPFAWQLSEETEATASLPPVALRRFRPAVPAAILLEQEKPAHLRSGVIEGTVQERGGPYHSSGDWWDAQTWARAEWDLQLTEGAFCRCHRSDDKWEVDGVYD